MSNLCRIVRVMLTFIIVTALGGFLPLSTASVLANPGYGTITGNISDESITRAYDGKRDRSDP